jgi:hypothetical protein
MTQDPGFYMIISAFALVSIGLLAFVTLRGWRDWIDYKHAELASHHQPLPESNPSAVSRIEVADLKERVKKLEAIAAGIDI